MLLFVPATLPLVPSYYMTNLHNRFKHFPTLVIAIMLVLFLLLFLSRVFVADESSYRSLDDHEDVGWTYVLRLIHYFVRNKTRVQPR